MYCPRHWSLSTETCTEETFSSEGHTIPLSTSDWITRSTTSQVMESWPAWSTSLYQESAKVKKIKLIIFLCMMLIIPRTGGDCVSYTDLNNLPWLFKGKGDIQFDVYRDMRNNSKWVPSHCEACHPRIQLVDKSWLHSFFSMLAIMFISIDPFSPNRSEWRGFHPFNNVLWLNYLATKVSIKAKLKGMSSKTWKRKLEPFIKKIKQYPSVIDVFLNVFSPDAVRKINATIKH